MAAKWDKFATKQKQKRTKTESNETRTEEIVVQRMSSEVGGKQQKYCGIGAREYVPFGHEELTIENIKDACQKHYRTLIGEGMTCDVLAGERGPSCKKISQVNDLKTLFVHFVQSDVEILEVPVTPAAPDDAKKVSCLIIA